ncbi:MAG: acetate--CoA ligase family protein [Candidatus Syntropharchaeia archaeon]
MVDKQNFGPLFYPESVAVVGASGDQRKMGYQCVKSLVEGGFRGKIYPVNPKLSQILGIKAYPSIKSIPGRIDLAMVIVPAKHVPSTMRECAEKGVKGVVIITGGFRESGEPGKKLEDEILAIGREKGIKIIGPNTFGFLNLHANLNASFTPTLGRLRKGNIALISQSGGLCHIIGYGAMDGGVGFSKIVGLGNRSNVEFRDMLEYLEKDPETKVISMYIEGIDKPRELMDAAKRISKPVVVLKAGKSEGIKKAFYSHTGSLAGNFEIYRAAFKQTGMITVDGCMELFDVSKALSMLPPPEGNGVGIISGQAGPAILIADACEQLGIHLAEFSLSTMEKLEELLPPLTIISNPVDMAFTGGDPEIRIKVARILLEEKNVHSLILFHLYYPSFEFPTKEILKLKKYGKPIIICMSSPRDFLKEERVKLEEGGIPVYPTPERTAKALYGLLRYIKRDRSTETRTVQDSSQG